MKIKAVNLFFPLFARHVLFVLFLIFMLSRKSSSYVTFPLIYFKQLLYLLIELRREFWKSVSQIFMYRRLADSELPCSRPDSRFMTEHIFAQHNRAFFLGLNHFYDHPFQYIWCNSNICVRFENNADQFPFMISQRLFPISSPVYLTCSRVFPWLPTSIKREPVVRS